MPLTELLMLNLPVVQSLGPYVTGAIAAVVVYLVLGNSTNRKLSRVPPGPKPLPLIGNLVRVSSPITFCYRSNLN